MPDSEPRGTAAGPSLRKGLLYLAAQQSADGGWRSQKYGQLKEGAALTALVLRAFSQAPVALQEEFAQPIQRGLTFLDAGLERRKTIAAADGTLDFPTYGAAHWLQVCQRLKLAEAAPKRKRQQQILIDYLLAAQIGPARKFAKDHPAFGGWDLLGAGDAQGITTGSNISVVVAVLEGLRGHWPEGEESPGLIAAQDWLRRCQQPDGGFAFTPEPQSLNNKAAYHDPQQLQPHSYASATADGLRALIASGKQAEDPACLAASAWLQGHSGLEKVPGFEHLAAELGWAESLRYYYYQSLAASLRHLPKKFAISQAEALIKVVVASQAADGSWKNPADRMRENDPLVSTAFAVMTLAECGEVLG